MTDELDDHVEDRIGDNLATLEKAFAAKTVTDQNALESSTSVIGWSSLKCVVIFSLCLLFEKLSNSPYTLGHIFSA